MRLPLHIISTTLLCALLIACATPYQQNAGGFSVRGGFNDFELEPGKHYVSFEANNWTDKTQAMKYWHQRAGELCPGGYDMLSNESKDQIRSVSEDGAVITDTRVEGYIQCRM